MSDTQPIVEGGAGDNESVARYYRETAIDYRRRMILEGHRSIHFGYFEPGDLSDWTVFGHDHARANRRLKELLADAADVTPGTRILDAGCGIGEPALWLAETRDAEVIGLNITESQLEKARANARERGLADRTDFRYDDFMEMESVPDGSVDVVWGLESLCYANEKRGVLAQAKRVLRPGGTLVVADGFMNERTLTDREQQWMETYLEGWAVPHFAHHEDFLADLDALGFQDVEYRDVTERVMPSSKILYRLATMVLPVGKLLHRLGLKNDVTYGNWKAALTQYKALERRIWVYGIVTATLPEAAE